MTCFYYALCMGFPLFKSTDHWICVGYRFIHSSFFCHQQMRRTGNKDENKRILMDLDVVLKSHDCPYIIQCYGAIVTNVGVQKDFNDD